MGPVLLKGVKNVYHHMDESLRTFETNLLLFEVIANEGDSTKSLIEPDSEGCLKLIFLNPEMWFWAKFKKNKTTFNLKEF